MIQNDPWCVLYHLVDVKINVIKYQLLLVIKFTFTLLHNIYDTYFDDKIHTNINTIFPNIR